ncbi:PREDICTED: RNA-binding motif protein, X-linked 2 isoform X2 [Pseudopodoces humilis]|uniref:RNA-binding motif protein, X-linked 2 isoform X2 n=1 Tax=Pseudopodoces humilis TaxID=181119 RepID=UPI0006B6FB17|nr:PREDICTED: RNA-binding motif protein, X-linked 2 isoform X2 [Pseudopodoces humilis]
MNPLTKVKLINELNAREAELGVQEAVSWHAEYKDSAWIFVGGLHYELTEGDVICVFSQYGEIVNINLVRDKKTGKSKGFCFLCYEDQRSTILAVDNFNGIKESEDWDEVTRALHAKGCGVKTPPHTSSDSPSEDEDVPVKKQKEKQRSRAERSKSSPQAGKRVSTEEPHPRIRIKKEKEDPGYERYAGGSGDRNAGSRTQREEEQRRHQRHSDRRGDKNCHQQRGHSGSWEEREKKDEAGRRGDGRSGRQDASPRGSKSREPHSRHRERGSGRDSGRC